MWKREREKQHHSTILKIETEKWVEIFVTSSDKGDRFKMTSTLASNTQDKIESNKFDETVCVYDIEFHS